MQTAPKVLSIFWRLSKQQKSQTFCDQKRFVDGAIKTMFLV
jgi:hypothetical protein